MPRGPFPDLAAAAPAPPLYGKVLSGALTMCSFLRYNTRTENLSVRLPREG